MLLRKRNLLSASLATLLALTLAGCGGSDPAKVYVMGDSLADVGTFGLKFTVQDANNPRGFPLWTQLTATRYGMDGNGQCNYYVFRNNSYAANSQAGCTNYAIGGGRIVVSAANGGSANPQTIGTQMAAAAAQGSFQRDDLILVDGGGNDAADLVGAWLGATSGTAGVQRLQGFLAQQLEAATLQALLTQDSTGVLAAGAYMQKLAETFQGQIKSQLLDKGAQRVVVLNMPDITLTPRFAAVLTGVAAQTSPAQALQVQGAIRAWIGAFNARLAELVATEKRVALVNFYGTFSQQVQSPASFGLTNVTDTACPVKGVGSDGLPEYDFPSCTSAALDATPGKSPGWWKTYMFSDGFHPTPKAHELMADTVTSAIRKAGWL